MADTESNVLINTEGTEREISQRGDAQPLSSPQTDTSTVLLNLILFISLYLFAFSIAIIFHIWIERIIPDLDPINIFNKLQTGGNYIFIALAAILVFFPIFSILAIKLQKDTRTESFLIRKVFMYILLISTGLHVIFLLYQFLSGSGSLNAILHLCVSVLIAAPIFLYVIAGKAASASKNIIFFILMTLLGVTAIGYGISTVPSPMEQQKMKLDKQKVSDLKNIQNKILKYFVKNYVLPNASFLEKDLKNKQQQQPYEYKIVAPISYKLCANFDTNSLELRKKYSTDNKITPERYDHPKGNYCFTTTIEKKYLPAKAKLISLKRVANCKWIVSMALENFTPDSPININSKGRLADQCDPAKAHDYVWSGLAGQLIEQDGTALIESEQNDYGHYTYTFTDKNHKSASVTIEYASPSATLSPTINPINTNDSSQQNQSQKRI